MTSAVDISPLWGAPLSVGGDGLDSETTSEEHMTDRVTDMTDRVTDTDDTEFGEKETAESTGTTTDQLSSVGRRCGRTETLIDYTCINSDASDYLQIEPINVVNKKQVT
eukprot:Selendium_serpulae@DN6500_c3_g1_i8.p2